MLSLFRVISILGALVAVNSMMEKTWSYYPISIDVKTSNEALLKPDIQVERISRTVFSTSGSIDFNYDITDDTFVEVIAYRSSSGNSDYEKLPFGIEKSPFYDVANSFYKDLVMESFANCSNLPQFEDEIERPFEKKTYVLKQCQVSNEKMPDHMQDGFYKVLVIFTGPVEWEIEVLLKIENK